MEARVVRGLMARGVPAALAKALPWAVKLLLLAVLAYAALWLAVLLVLGVVVVVVVSHGTQAEDDPDAAEWREGHSGFGLYDKNEWRRDMGDPDN